MEVKHLPRVTLIVCDTQSPGRALAALRRSLTQIKPARTILFTNVKMPVKEEIEVIQIPLIRSKAEYSRWILRELHAYIQTEFVLVSQWDGYVIDGSQWTDDFLSVDYIGASWVESDGFAVGNGGLSIRSKRLMEVAATDPTIVSTHPEDNMLSKVYRPYLEAKYGFKWASEELADRFSFELKEPIQPTFGFHSFFHNPFAKTIIISRQASLGDIIHLEPVMHYFHKKGYRVVLDTLPQFYNLFLFHYFKIYHPGEVDQRILATATTYDLNMSYESTPDRLHLLSYYQMAGIEDGDMRNPKLTLQFDPKTPQYKLFKKYCIFHNDRRGQEGRNSYGVDWDVVAQYLIEKGYTVVQVGHGEHETPKGVVEMRNMNEPLLMRLIGGADLFLGCDSGPFNIALAMDTPAVVWFGSVNPDYIIPDKKNVTVISNHNTEKPICRLPHCWSSAISTEGVECVETHGVINRVTKMWQGTECVEHEAIPPCVRFTTEQIIDAINQRI